MEIDWNTMFGIIGASVVALGICWGFVGLAHVVRESEFSILKPNVLMTDQYGRIKTARSKILNCRKVVKRDGYILVLEHNGTIAGSNEWKTWEEV